jgi:hypothetical protein
VLAPEIEEQPESPIHHALAGYFIDHW